MDVLNAIEKRFSCRSYIDKKIPEKHITTILDAAIKAPNAGNLQVWRFVIVAEEEIKVILMQSCLQQNWMLIAPIFIVVCAELE
ncbi:nitroreductase family protein, partial [archaeon]|nr:nitroreductase family protein [archaeon]